MQTAFQVFVSFRFAPRAVSLGPVLSLTPHVGQRHLTVIEGTALRLLPQARLPSSVLPSLEGFITGFKKRKQQINKIIS